MSDNSSTPAISIIVPIYNVEEYLEECLESLEQQTYHDFEVLMIDDGSPDRSYAICREFESRDTRFHYFRKKNGGLGDARNYGIGKAQGQFLAFIDSDDILAKDILENMYARLTTDESDFAICMVGRFNSTRKWSSLLHSKAILNTPSVTTIRKSSQLIYDSTVCNKLIRRSFWDKCDLSFPVGLLYEDIPVSAKMHCFAEKVSVLEECGYYWRARDGVTSSITQNVTDPSNRNLHDRLTSMRRVNALFKEEACDETLRLTKSVKFLDIDISIFLDACTQVGESQAQEIFDELIRFIDESVDPFAFTLLPLIDQQKYRLLFARDYQGLKQLAAFRPAYKKLEVHDTGDDLVVDLPQDLFGLEDKSVKREIAQMPPSVFIDDAALKEDHCILECHLFKPRVNIKEGDLDVTAYLCNDRTCTRLPLKVTPTSGKKFSKLHSLVYDEANSAETHYCYDGACFNINLDYKDISNLRELAGSNRIIIAYSSKHYKGAVVLRGMSASAESSLLGKVAIADTCAISLSSDLISTLVVAVKTDMPLCDISQDNDKLTITTPRHSAFAQDRGGKIVPFMSSGEELALDPLNLQLDTDYKVFFTDEDGKPFPVLLAKKKVRIFDFSSSRCLVLSTKDHSLRLRRIGSCSQVLNISREGSVFTFELQHLGNNEEKPIEALQVLSEGEVEHALVPLCTTDRLDNDTFRARVDFSDSGITRNLYESDRGICARITFADGSQSTELIYSEKYFKKKFAKGTFEASLYRSSGGRLRMHPLLRWGKSQDTSEKRKAVVRDEYPEMLKLPLDSKLILFESSWGSAFSCNPRTIYEYIQKHYPEYKCVWSLNDPRTPITGKAKRVRRLSRDYYKCLAQAKYIVSNVNFPGTFIKREGQVALQTMRSTPLKKYGLEVPPNKMSNEEREAYIMRNSRWDYLVVQGEFMKQKAWDCFRYSAAILETGFPRTDKTLAAEKNAVEARKALGIPANKKAILYMPIWDAPDNADSCLDLAEMKSLLESKGYVMLVKSYRLLKMQSDETADSAFIIDVTGNHDIELLSAASDLLVTDFSPQILDYALTNKPMVFHLGALQEHVSDLEDCYIDLKSEAPGPVAYTTRQTVDAILAGDACKEKVRNFKERFLTYENECSTKTLVKEFLRPKTVCLDRLLKKIKRAKAGR